ncbi:DUF1573 domain-containing protein [Robertkochia solimangrovi]|uniref:DUF1573 domain-containing protein n=1 Tax=Robertkochia solimangrovi TaxID=2213046 RepID=UPI001180F2CF|nr:DUF1573 domain-containing protein [Robertkochia solimangrovi]TRZ42754.1 hypothetical protein DMZ48_11830 [Robertkochia solimangrovi]
MKKVLVILGICALLPLTSCKEDASAKIKSENVEMAEQRDEAATKFPVMTFEEKVYDFGTIPKGVPVEKVFKFKNTGDAPLVITSAKSSCGCTIPEWMEDKPVAPGETGEILVKYNASGVNDISKTVTIMANTEKGSEQIVIKAFVEAKSDAEGESKA